MIEPILFWNLRGLGTSKRRLVKLVHMYKPKIIALVESFLNDSHLSRLQTKEDSVSNEDSGGKIWLSWASGVKITVLNYFAQFVTIRLKENNCQLLSLLFMLSANNWKEESYGITFVELT